MLLTYKFHMWLLIRVNKKLDGTLWTTINDYACACCNLELLTQKPNRHVFMPGRPNCSEIISRSYKDFVFTLTFVSLPTVSLTFDLLTPKSNQHTYEPKYICGQDWMQFPVDIRDVFTRFSGLVDGHAQNGMPLARKA